MYVPESFFNGEIRNGFYVEKLMKKAWAASIEVLHDVDLVCKKYNIQYFADYGTLLGAVRHKGFIPWDDDIDIVMKRKDYIRFCKIANTLLSEEYEILNIHTQPEWNHVNARIVNKRKISFNKDRMKKFHGCPFLVGIDIYILDYIPSDEQEAELQRDIIKIIASVIIDLNNNIEQQQCIDKIHFIESICNIKLRQDKPYSIQLKQLLENLCMIYNEDESNNIANMAGYPVKPKLFYYKEYYESSIEVPFEYTTVQIPIGYKEILIKEFGENYMTPCIIASSHDYPFYKKQLYSIYDANGNI